MSHWTILLESVARDIRAAFPKTHQVAVQRRFRTLDGREIEPHIVMASNSDRDVLVADVKYAPPLSGPGDVHRGLEDVEKWKSLLSEYVSTLQNNPDVLAQHFQWKLRRRVTVFGLILLPWPLPVPVEFAEPIYAVDWHSLRGHLQQQRARSMREVMAWARKQLDATVAKGHARTTKEGNVGEGMNQDTLLAPLPKERLFELTQTLAYKFWEKRGRPLWDDQRDWYDAEKYIASHPHLDVNLELSEVASGQQNQPPGGDTLPGFEGASRHASLCDTVNPSSSSG